MTGGGAGAAGWRQGWQRVAAGGKWQETGLVFTSALGTELNAANVRRESRKVLSTEQPGAPAPGSHCRSSKHEHLSFRIVRPSSR